MADNLDKLKEEDVVVLKKNSVYRVADVFYRAGWRWAKRQKNHSQRCRVKDSIMFDYLTEKRKEGDLETLCKIVKRHSEKNQYPQADPNHLVVHMRLGDVMDNHRKQRCMNKYNEFMRGTV